MDELGEVLEMKGSEEIGGEADDVMAWLASLANVAGVDLEQVALKKYNGKCPECEKERCRCPF